METIARQRRLRFVDNARSLPAIAQGTIPRPAAFDYIWGDELAKIERAGVDLPIVREISKIILREVGIETP